MSVALPKRIKKKGLGNVNKRGLSYMLSSGVQTCAQKSLITLSKSVNGKDEGISTSSRFVICS